MSINEIRSRYLRGLKKRKQRHNIRSSYSMNRRFIAGIAAGTWIPSVLATGSAQMQSKFSTIISSLNQDRVGTQNLVNHLPSGDYSLRNAGVNLAWKYEQGILELGGRGTANWSLDQRQELLANGRVRGFEGHHINDVSSHPGEQGNPDNIMFLTNKEHLKAHGGDWRNPTSGKMYNREGIMRGQVIKGEIGRFGLALLIGMGIGMAIASFDSRLTFKEKIQHGFEGAKIGGIGYIGGRIGSMVISAVSTNQISQAAQLFGIGVAASIATSLYVFYKVKKAGGTTNQALKGAGLNVAVSLVGVFLSCMAVSIWGGPAGVIVGIIYGIGLIAYNFYNKKKMERTIRRLRYYEIGLLQPQY